MKYRLFFIFVAVCVLSNCAGTTSSADIPEYGTEYSLYINENFTDSKACENKFIQKIKDNLDGNYTLFDFLCDDFDGNGKDEMFAVLQSEENNYDFSLWFVSESEFHKIDDKYRNAAYSFETLPDNTKIVLVTDMLNTRIVTPVYCFYFVKDGMLNSYKCEDFTKNYGDIYSLNFNNGCFYAEDISACDTNNSRWGTVYRIDWTGKEFKEMPVKEITINELTTMDNNDIINLPENITNIYLRGDGSININFGEGENERSISYFEKDGTIVGEITKKFFSDTVNYNAGYYVNDYFVKKFVLSEGEN